MKSSILTILGGASTVLASYRGFNYASQGQSQDGFASQFKTAAALQGANDFTSARLYTMIQEGTTNTPVSAIQAAIDTNTSLLLGLWASGASDGFNNELAALKSAIQQYGSKLADLTVGISVGSEDLYRISPTGIANGEGVGQSPDVLVNYISQVRDTIKGTGLSSKPVGHVDTWNVYVNSSNSKVIAACDWLGLDEYPYYQTTDSNSIDNAKNLFFQAYDKVSSAAGGKPIWVTEAGWPTSGPNSNLAVASTDNAARFWKDVACELECRNVNFWWYTLQDAGASGPSFGVSNGGKPLYDLSCGPCGSSSNSSNSTSSGSSSSGSNSTATVTGSGPGGATTMTATATAGGAGGSGAPSGGASSGASGTSSAGPAQYTSNGASQAGASVVALIMGAVVAFFTL